MKLLILGLGVFFFIHLLPTFTNLREKFINRLGALGYRAVFSVFALTGLILIVTGKMQAEFIHVWQAPVWTRSITHGLMLVAFISLTASFIPTNIRRITRHPMLLGLCLWAVAHLLVNGDMASVILFGYFLLFSLFVMWSTNRRGVSKSTVRQPILKDIITLGIGVIVFALIGYLHPYIFGVSTGL